ncbi:MAG: HDOD domain-containing protein [Planctomycetes bacterium]|nr:HDOD domain-containing protein [Planctomycetota bacterium]
MPNDASKTRRIELILRQIESLPTLPAVAIRLLQLTSSDDSNAREVVEVVRADPALTAKVLALSRQADRGVREEVVTVDKAVVLLGFNAIRTAVLSVKVFETYGPNSKLNQDDDAGEDASADRFDRAGFWRHCLAVAVAAELIAAAHGDSRELPPAEAFVAGLLHDIGKLALDHVLPKSFARVIELTEHNQGNIAEFERRIIGLDHHTAGKRLAEQWQLPHRLQDCIWLHGSSWESLPRLDHRKLVGLISLADLIVRQHHLGFSGNFVFKHNHAELASQIGLDPAKVDKAVARLHEEVERRASVLGLDERPSRELFLQSIQQANQVLGRLNAALERRSRTAARQTTILDAITAFHAASVPGRTVEDVMNQVAVNAASVLGEGFYALLHQANPGDGGQTWLLSQYDGQGRPARSNIIDPPAHVPDLTQADATEPSSLNLMGIVPWIADQLADVPDLREVRVLPLSCGWGTAALLLHDRPALPPWKELSALAHTWGASIAAAGQHEGAKRLGEELADANRALAEAHDRLLHSESLARLGEMAAGAAHEMNNPLAVISGRGQILAMALPGGSKEQKAAQTICEQAHRLSDLITSLKQFATPTQPVRKPTNIGALLDETLKRVRTDLGEAAATVTLDLKIKNQLPAMKVDPEMIQSAVAELIHNAIQAHPRTWVHVTAQADENERRLVIQVIDDGVGMDAHTLAHAMDPFFSAKPAGRRVGMGLPRAQQLVSAHNGWIDLRSTPTQGTIATLILPLE